MNTNTNKIFEKLSKVKEAKEKQELGAIEDAINKVTSDLDSKGQIISKMYDDISNANSELYDKLNSLSIEHKNITENITSEYEILVGEYEEILTELEDNGVNYDSSLVMKAIDDISYEVSTANGLINKLEA